MIYDLNDTKSDRKLEKQGTEDRGKWKWEGKLNGAESDAWKGQQQISQSRSRGNSVTLDCRPAGPKPGDRFGTVRSIERYVADHTCASTSVLSNPSFSPCSLHSRRYTVGE